MRVLIASEEKNWCEGRDLIEIRWFGCLVNNRGRRSGCQPDHAFRQGSYLSLLSYSGPTLTHSPMTWISVVPRHFLSDSTLILGSGMAVSLPCAVQRAHIQGSTDLMPESSSNREHTQELSSVVDFKKWSYLGSLASIGFEVVNGHPLLGRRISSMIRLAVIMVLSNSAQTVSNRPTRQPIVKWTVEKTHLCIDQNRIRCDIQMDHLCLLMQEH